MSKQQQNIREGGYGEQDKQDLMPVLGRVLDGVKSEKRSRILTVLASANPDQRQEISTVIDGYTVAAAEYHAANHALHMAKDRQEKAAEALKGFQSRATIKLVAIKNRISNQ